MNDIKNSSTGEKNEFADLLEALKNDEENQFADDIKTSNTSNVICDEVIIREVLSLCCREKSNGHIEYAPMLKALRTDEENEFADNIKTSNTSNAISDEERIREVLSLCCGERRVVWDNLLESLGTCVDNANDEVKIIQKSKGVQ